MPAIAGKSVEGRRQGLLEFRQQPAG